MIYSIYSHGNNIMLTTTSLDSGQVIMLVTVSGVFPPPITLTRKSIHTLNIKRR